MPATLLKVTLLRTNGTNHTKHHKYFMETVNYHKDSIEYLLNTFLTKNVANFVTKQLHLCKTSVNFSQTEDEDI